MCREIDGWALSTQYQQLLQRSRQHSNSRRNGVHNYGDGNGAPRSSNEIYVPITTVE
jgi:hypothetical protein